MSNKNLHKLVFMNAILGATLMHSVCGMAQTSKEAPLDQKFIERTPFFHCLEEKIKPQTIATGLKEGGPKESGVQTIQFYPAPPPAEPPRFLPPVPLPPDRFQYGFSGRAFDPVLSIPPDKRDEVVHYLKGMNLKNADTYKACIQYVKNRAKRQNEENLYKTMSWIALGYNKKIQLLFEEELKTRMGKKGQRQPFPPSALPNHIPEEPPITVQ